MEDQKVNYKWLLRQQHPWHILNNSNTAIKRRTLELYERDVKGAILKHIPFGCEKIA